MTLPLRPRRGGFLRPFGCAWFIREFLKGNGPFDSVQINPGEGAPQADIFFHYKNAIRRITALDRATRQEEKAAKKQNRTINPENIETLSERYLDRLPYKATGARFHSFVVYFSNLVRLGWVEFTGKESPSSFQNYYKQGPPRRYFRLTKKGLAASDDGWANPLRALHRVKLSRDRKTGR